MALGAWPAKHLWVCAVRERDGRPGRVRRDARPALPDAVGGIVRQSRASSRPSRSGGRPSSTEVGALARRTRCPLGCRPSGLVAGQLPDVGGGATGRVWHSTSPVDDGHGWPSDPRARRLRRSGAHVLAFPADARRSARDRLNPMDPTPARSRARQARESTPSPGLRTRHPDTTAPAHGVNVGACRRLARGAWRLHGRRRPRKGSFGPSRVPRRALTPSRQRDRCRGPRPGRQRRQTCRTSSHRRGLSIQAEVCAPSSTSTCTRPSSSFYAELEEVGPDGSPPILDKLKSEAMVRGLWNLFSCRPSRPTISARASRTRLRPGPSEKLSGVVSFAAGGPQLCTTRHGATWKILNLYGSDRVRETAVARSPCAGE